MTEITKDSNTPTPQLADSCTSPTMYETVSDIRNFSINNTEHLQQLVTRWANSVYPERTIQDTLVKLLEEVAELFKTPNEEELACACHGSLAGKHQGRSLV